jgi:demethylmenaquinone methyltransferase/2-methoxy-6-polyprenyl-1,4-benzoquinol methylase
MFGRIARTYDLLNRLFSLGVDRKWRSKAIRHLKLDGPLLLLDCSAGTGDMSLTAHREDPSVRTYLLDPALEMLTLADAKAGFISPSQFDLVKGVAEALPFQDESFDRFTVAFGIRNFVDLRAGLGALYRVLRSGGRGVILEFTPDRARVIDRMFRWYMRHVMIPMGARISGDPQAYAYLNRTVQSFASALELSRLFTDVGFHCAEVKPLSFGIAHLFVLEKP